MFDELSFDCMGILHKIVLIRVQSQNIQIEIGAESVNFQKAGTKNDNEAR